MKCSEFGLNFDAVQLKQAAACLIVVASEDF